MSLSNCNRQAHLSPAQKYSQARLAFERGELEVALQTTEQGLATSSGAEYWRFRVLKAEVLVWKGSSKDALALLSPDFPQALANDEAGVRRKLVEGIADYHLQRFDESGKALQEAEVLAHSAHPELEGEIAVAEGTLAVMSNDLGFATSLFRKALKLARQSNSKFAEVNSLGSLGYLELRSQHYDESINWSEQALNVARELGNQSQVSKLLGNLGWCYFKLGDYDRALSNFQEAERLTTELGLQRDRLNWLNNIGLIYSQRHEHAVAMDEYKSALSIARSLESKTLMGICLANLAYSALDTGQYDLADQYNREALELKRSVGDKNEELYAILNSARINAGQKQYSEAAKLFREVIYGAGNDESLRWEAESNLAALYAGEGKDVTADLQYKKGLETIDRARAALSKDEHRLSFLNTATRFYNDYIDFLIAHHREREALAVAEHSRARTLAEGLKIPVQLRETAFHPEENARRLNSVVLSYWLKPERSYLWVVTPTRVQLFPLPPQSEIDAAVDDYRKALLGPSQARDSAAGQKLYQMLVAPAEKLINTNARHPERSALQRAESRDLYSSPHHEPQLRITSSPNHSGNVAAHVITTTTRSENVAPHVSAGSTTASLSRVAQPRDGRSTNTVPRVIVIADGSLVNLNFETIMVPSIPQPHYWIEDATISNASSIALLRSSARNGTMARSPDGTINHGLLLIGAPEYAGTEFPELSQARTEVDKVESYFPADGRTVIEGKSAVPAAYDQAKPGEFTYIHFVAHGTASRLSPLDSSIVLSRQGDAYKLYARDIMQQPLKADLVTISACYGAGNRSYSGEGLVGLSWAFLRAGAHHVIAALWEVNDASTPKLMDDLYRNIKNGEDPATALRRAKLDMLHSDNVYRRPFYWGAFQLYVGS